MNIKLIVAVLLILTTIYANANDYNTGIGVRGGTANGLTIKHFYKKDVAIEGIVSSWWRGGIGLTGLYEITKENAFKVDRLNWYYGIGGDVGFFDRDNRYYNSTVIMGIDAILGLEYNIEEIPINVSLDFKPSLKIIGDPGFWWWGDGFGFSVRYVF